MTELTPAHLDEIMELHASAEFARFREALESTAEESNTQSVSVEKFDLSNISTGVDSGTISYRECSFDFYLDKGTAAGRKADIVYRFRFGEGAAGGINGHGTNGNGNGDHEPDEELPGDPRNTPWMRYQPEIIGSGVEPGLFAFYWDGEATEELAESLLREFVEWVA